MQVENWEIWAGPAVGLVIVLGLFLMRLRWIRKVREAEARRQRQEIERQEQLAARLRAHQARTAPSRERPSLHAVSGKPSTPARLREDDTPQRAASTTTVDDDWATRMQTGSTWFAPDTSSTSSSSSHCSSSHHSSHDHSSSSHDSSSYSCSSDSGSSSSDSGSSSFD
jgi:type II secretory pathway pseudopilin PulG